VSPPRPKESWTKKTVLGMSMLSIVILIACLFACGLSFLGYYLYLEIRYRIKNRHRAQPGVVDLSEDSAVGLALNAPRDNDIDVTHDVESVHDESAQFNIQEQTEGGLPSQSELLSRPESEISSGSSSELNVEQRRHTEQLLVSDSSPSA
jgi:hypothetical protein